MVSHLSLIPRPRLAGLFLTFLLGLGGWPLALRANHGIALSELQILARLQLEEELIWEQIQRHGLAFPLTLEALQILRNEGLSDTIIEDLVRQEGLSLSEDRHRETVRIIRSVGADGRPRVILTNLDEDGRRIVDPSASEGMIQNKNRVQESDPSRFAPVPSPSDGPADLVAPPEAPVVVVNVEAPASSPTLVPAVPYYPMFAGVLVGSYHYPKNHGFLGYGTGISRPGWFSGLGLNATNNFGHRVVDKPNVRGYRAFFGPPRRH